MRRVIISLSILFLTLTLTFGALYQMATAESRRWPMQSLEQRPKHPMGRTWIVSYDRLTNSFSFYWFEW
jgi:hypothetical protein